MKFQMTRIDQFYWYVKIVSDFEEIENSKYLQVWFIWRVEQWNVHLAQHVQRPNSTLSKLFWRWKEFSRTSASSAHVSESQGQASKKEVSTKRLVTKAHDSKASKITYKFVPGMVFARKTRTQYNVAIIARRKSLLLDR